jgi:tubulin-like protein CetZ
MKPIMIVGVGQCGGNIADVAETKGYPTLAINSYKGDLDSLKNVLQRLHLSGYNGAGKNRENGKQALKDNLDIVIESISAMVSEQPIKIILVAFSADGGTGSGSGPLLIQVLSEVFPEIIIGAIPVLPLLTDSIGSIANASECITELSEIETLGACLFADNQKTWLRTSNRKELYNFSNSDIINRIDDLYKATVDRSTDGNFDEADLISVFSARGAMIIGRANLNQNINEINTNIKISLDGESVFASPEYDQRIVNAAFIYRASNAAMKHFSKDNIFSQIGMPIEVFEGYYGYPKTMYFKDHKIITALSGLSFPFKRLNEMERIIEENKNKIEQNFQTSVSQRFEGKSGWVNNLRGGKRKTEKTEEVISLADKLKRFK